MDWLEIIASILGVISVWLGIKQNIFCWPIGIVMVSLYTFVFYQVHLYSAMILQIIYVFLQIYGWYHWLKGNKSDHKLLVSRLSKLELNISLIIGIIATVILGYFMNRYTSAHLVYWDAATTVISLIAQWFMARKVLECWFGWMIVNVLAIGIYWVKELYLTTGLYFVFLIMAVLGFIEWKKTLLVNKKT